MLSGTDIQDGLVRQVDSPVLWSETIRRLRKDGFETFVEIGTGSVLSGLVRRVDRSASCVAVGGPIRVGNRLWFYYSDRRHWNRPGSAPSEVDMQMGIATLRVDGFASLNAGEQPGSVVTRPC